MFRQMFESDSESFDGEVNSRDTGHPAERHNLGQLGQAVTLAHRARRRQHYVQSQENSEESEENIADLNACSLQCVIAEAKEASFLPMDDQLKSYHGKGYACARTICSVFLVCGMLIFILPGLGMIFNGNLEIFREENAWEEGSLELPFIAFDFFGGDSDSYILQVEHQSRSFKSGTKTKHTTPITTTRCDISAGAHRQHIIRNATCLPQGLHVIGSYGDPEYKYVTVELLVPATQIKTKVKVALVFERWLTKDSVRNQSTKYEYSTVNMQVRNHVEIFFKKMIAMAGSPFGFVSMFQNELEDVLPKTYYPSFAMQKTDSQPVKEEPPGFKGVLKFYFRADLAEVKEFYDHYSFMALLEKSGGLWTAIAFTVSAVLLCIFWLHHTVVSHGDDGYPSPRDYDQLP